jgi:signal transduction histidine kinase
LDTAQVDVDELVHETIDALAGTVPERVSVSEQSGARGTAVGDRNRLQQVLMNLLDNAVKYSPDGGAIVVRTAVDGDTVRLEVEDHGLGIPAGDRERIFEKFDRGDPGRRPAAGGTGLGLYICRELVERMGGRISVTSTLGAGSTFSVELPAAV